MNHLRSVGLALLASLACSPSPDRTDSLPDTAVAPVESSVRDVSPTISAADEDRWCRGIDNGFQCARAIEAGLLPGDSSRAIRRGDTLYVKRTNGALVPFVDSAEVNAETLHFSYAGTVGDRILVHVQYYEDDDYCVFAPASGKCSFVAMRPAASPDGSRMAVAYGDLESAPMPQAMQIWQVLTDSLRLEWETNPLDWIPSDPVWVDDSTVQITRSVLADPVAMTKRHDTIRVTRRGGEWTVRP